MYLVAHAVRSDVAALAAERADWHRGVRRFPVPAQLALGALEDVRGALDAPGAVGLVACAPCQAGSPEVHGWVQQIYARARAGEPPPRMNPTHTLHAIDNLVLSAAAIALGTHEEGVGVGGAPGQAWEALALAEEALARGVAEVVVLAGDQDDARAPSPALGVAIVLASRPRGRAVTRPVDPPVEAHAARPLAAWLAEVTR